MKLLFVIHEKYKEPEIHICSDKKSREICDIRDLLEKMLCTQITAYREQEAKTLPAFEIVRIYSENKKVFARTAGETYEVRDRLYRLEEIFCDKGFVRISNSEIVNLSQIDRFDMGYTGTIRVYLKNGDETYVSRRYVAKIKEVLG